MWDFIDDYSDYSDYGGDYGSDYTVTADDSNPDLNGSVWDTMGDTGTGDWSSDWWGPSADNPNLERGFDLDAARQAEMDRYYATLQPDYVAPDVGDYGVQDLGITDANWNSYQNAMQGIWDNGGYSSGWQTTPDGSRVMIQDDGSAISIGKDGNVSGLLSDQVQQMIKNGQLNTWRSGYNEATGGGIFGPGGTGKLTTIGSLLGKIGNAMTGGSKTGSSGSTGSKSGSGGGGGDGSSGSSRSGQVYGPGVNPQYAFLSLPQNQPNFRNFSSLFVPGTGGGLI